MAPASVASGKRANLGEQLTTTGSDMDNTAPAPHGQASTEQGDTASRAPRPRVALLTMKSQLRGRIRREVTTLLDRDYDVLIVGLQAKADFLQGLEHPNLEVRLLKPESIYTKGVSKTRTALLLMSPGGRARMRG